MQALDLDQQDDAIAEALDDFAGGMGAITRSGAGGKSSGASSPGKGFTPPQQSQILAAANDSAAAEAEREEDAEDEKELDPDEIINAEDLLNLLDPMLIAELGFDEAWLESMPDGLSNRGRYGALRLMMSVQLLMMLQQQNAHVHQAMILRQLQAMHAQARQIMRLPPALQAQAVQRMLQSPQLRQAVLAAKESLPKSALPQRANFTQLANLAAQRVITQSHPVLMQLRQDFLARIEKGQIAPNVQRQIMTSLELLRQMTQQQLRPMQNRISLQAIPSLFRIAQQAVLSPVLDAVQKKQPQQASPPRRLLRRAVVSMSNRPMAYLRRAFQLRPVNPQTKLQSNIQPILQSAPKINATNSSRPAPAREVAISTTKRILRPLMRRPLAQQTAVANPLRGKIENLARVQKKISSMARSAALPPSLRPVVKEAAEKLEKAIFKPALRPRRPLRPRNTTHTHSAQRTAEPQPRQRSDEAQKQKEPWQQMRRGRRPRRVRSVRDDHSSRAIPREQERQEAQARKELAVQEEKRAAEQQAKQAEKQPRPNEKPQKDKVTVVHGPSPRHGEQSEKKIGTNTKVQSLDELRAKARGRRAVRGKRPSEKNEDELAPCCRDKHQKGLVQRVLWIFEKDKEKTH